MNRSLKSLDSCASPQRFYNWGKLRFPSCRRRTSPSTNSSWKMPQRRNNARRPVSSYGTSSLPMPVPEISAGTLRSESFSGWFGFHV